MDLKVDTTRVGWTCTKDAVPRTDFETGQPKIDKASGLPLYAVQMLALDDSGGEVLTVTVPGQPNVIVGQRVTVTNLLAMPWSQNGRAGIAFRADAITAVDSKPGAPRS